MFAQSFGRLARTTVPSVSIEVAGLRWRQMRKMCSVGTGDHQVFVGNLTYETTEDELKEHLEPVVSVKEVTILKNIQGKNLGCAVVAISSEQDKDKMKNLEDSFLWGRRLIISDYRPRTNQPKQEKFVEEPSARSLHAQGPKQVKKPRAAEKPEVGSIKYLNGAVVKRLKEGVYRGHDVARTVVVWGLHPLTKWTDLRNMADQCCGTQKAVEYAEVIKGKRAIFELQKRPFGLIRFRTVDFAERFVVEAQGQFKVGKTILQIKMAWVKDEEES